MAIDAILNIYINVTGGLVVYEKVITQHVQNELPFMATENIMMDAVKKGGDRQALHERIRVHSMEAARQVKMEGQPNDLIDRIAADPVFQLSREELDKILKPEQFIGRAQEQVREFLRDDVEPVLAANQQDLGIEVELKV